MNTFIKEDSSYTTISRKLGAILESFGFAFESTRRQKREGDKKISFYTVSVGLSNFISEYLERGGGKKSIEKCLINTTSEEIYVTLDETLDENEECLVFNREYTHEEMFEVIKQHFPTNVKTGTYILSNIEQYKNNKSVIRTIFAEIQYDKLIQE